MCGKVSVFTIFNSRRNVLFAYTSVIITVLYSLFWCGFIFPICVHVELTMATYSVCTAHRPSRFGVYPILDPILLLLIICCGYLLFCFVYIDSVVFSQMSPIKCEI
jgi:hypothetical protein